MSSQPDTKERILDAAEKLFARDGFHCTSLRAITGEAAVNLAAVNYHFGSKEALIEAVFARRLQPLNEIRRKRLEDVRRRAVSEGRSPRVDEVLRAFIEPTLHFRDSAPGAREFITMVGQALAEPSDTVRNIFMNLMSPVFLFFFDCLAEALPEMPKDLLFWRLHFTMGAMSHTMCLRDKVRLAPAGIDAACDTDRLIEMLMAFLTAGMEAP